MRVGREAPEKLCGLTSPLAKPKDPKRPGGR